MLHRAEDRVVSPDTRRAERRPPGQHLTRKFPVLTYGATPQVSTAEWRFGVTGLVQDPRTWTWDEFHALGTHEVLADFHCVTTWSRLDNLWTGVLTRTLLGVIRLRPEARYVTVHCHGGYTTNLPLDVFGDTDCLFAYLHDGKPLELDHGGPMRLVVPKRYAWKSAKWVQGVELTAEDRPGFWEVNGYSNSADPWLEERYW